MITPKIKILMIIDNLACGGKERRLLSLLKGFRQNDIYDIELALIDDVIFYKNIDDIKLHILKRRIKKDPLIFYKMYRLCKKIKPDIIHSWGTMPSVYSLPVAKLLRIKFINGEIANTLLNGSVIGKIRSKLTIHFSDIVIANSHLGLEVNKVPIEKAYCIHNGFDYERITELESEESIKKALGIRTPNVVGMVAAVLPKKDYITYILAAIDILSRKKDVSFLIIGDGYQLESFKKLTQNWEKIIYTGERHDVESLVNIMDVCVMVTNSNIAQEGISNSILEYMALGKPVIATSGGATQELVKEGVTGFLVESRNPQILAEKIEFLLDNPDAAYKMGAAGKAVVDDEFSYEKMVFSTMNIYAKIMNGDRSINDIPQEHAVKQNL